MPITIRCPKCNNPLSKRDGFMVCYACGTTYGDKQSKMEDFQVQLNREVKK